MRRQDKYPETKWFIYDNVNPKNKITSDCVIRAITRAFNIEYDKALDLLVDTCRKTGYAITDKKNYEKLFKDTYKLEMQKQPRHKNNTKYTGKEFCEEFNKGIYICKIGGHHITVIVNGKIHDIWDCSDKTIGNYWKVK